MQAHGDKHKANCVQCVGGCNLKTCPDVRRLFKDFLYVLPYGRNLILVDWRIYKRNAKLNSAKIFS